MGQESQGDGSQRVDEGKSFVWASVGASVGAPVRPFQRMCLKHSTSISMVLSYAAMLLEARLTVMLAVN